MKLRKETPLDIPPGTVDQCGSWPFEGHEPQTSYFDINRIENPGARFTAVEPVATVFGRAVRTEDGKMELTVLDPRANGREGE